MARRRSAHSSLPLAAGSLAAALFLAVPISGAEEILLPRGGKTMWRYLDAGKAPEGDWKAACFDDAKWKSGPAPLGYGEDNLGTEVSFGESVWRKAMTTWFRTNPEIADPAKVETLLHLRRDEVEGIFHRFTVPA